MSDAPPVTARRQLAVVALAFAALLVAVSARYGYHRDELYFIAIGGHPAFGYVDQPPLVPLFAHALDVIGDHHLWVLRLPSALAGGGVVYLTGLIAREFGAPRRAQVFAACCMGASGVTLVISHLMSTTTYDVLGWTAISYLVLRAIRGDGRWWLAAGLAAGVALEIKTLPAFFLLALLVGILATGPRHLLASRWLWTGAAIALVLWLPNLIWQATHHWPQITLARAIANGSSGTSSSRALIVPMQFLIAGPPLAPFWVTGLVRLARRAQWRFLAVAWLVLVVVFEVTDGKPYYLSGLYPVLFAAGAEPVLAWAGAAATAARRTVVAVLLVAALLGDAVIGLPLVPVGILHDTPIVAMNYDAGETVGWPHMVDQITAAVQEAGPGTAVLAGNYGEASAVLHYAPDLPHVYGAQNSMWALGGPADGTPRAIVLGFDAADVHRWFRRVRLVGHLDNGHDVDDDEQGRPLYLCSDPITSWSDVWHRMRHYS